MPKILIVEDEVAIREVIRFALESADYQVFEAGQADEARSEINARSPDLILLDLMLPGQSGLELARQLKQNPKTRDLPIIMLTGKIRQQDKIAGFELGADDYIAKPFSPLELLARIKAVLHRTMPSGADAIIEVGSLRLDPSSHLVTAGKQTLRLSPTEYRLLYFFLTHQERVFDRSQLLDAVWGSEAEVEERTVDVHIRRLRKLLEPSGYQGLIHTVRGAGYRFSVKGTSNMDTALKT